MSSSSEPADNTKPVLKEKNPHNYRKVGYSMIGISVSLVLIALLVWSVGDNYHFASNIMAAQEVDAMTPKQDYNIVSFDYSQPVGAKVKLLDHASSIDYAMKLQAQYMQSIKGSQILIFGTSSADNVDVLAHAEVAAFTPMQGYNVILFNPALPVGAKLSSTNHDVLLVNATKHKQDQESQPTNKDLTVVIFSSSYDDNLKLVGVSGTIPPYDIGVNSNKQTNAESSTSSGNQTITATNSTSNGENQTSKILLLNETVGVNASNPSK